MALETATYFPDVRDKAIIFYGAECAQKTAELFEGYGLPGGLVPLEDLVEGGWVEETGFVWLVTRRSQQHHFKKADRLCSYDELISCTMEPKRMKNILGVKAKDMLVWVPVNDIYLDEKNPDKIHFKSIMGLKRSFATDCFVRGS